LLSAQVAPRFQLTVRTIEFHQNACLAQWCCCCICFIAVVCIWQAHTYSDLVTRLLVRTCMWWSWLSHADVDDMSSFFLWTTGIHWVAAWINRIEHECGFVLRWCVKLCACVTSFIVPWSLWQCVLPAMYASVCVRSLTLSKSGLVGFGELLFTSSVDCFCAVLNMCCMSECTCLRIFNCVFSACDSACDFLSLCFCLQLFMLMRSPNMIVIVCIVSGVATCQLLCPADVLSVGHKLAGRPPSVDWFWDAARADQNTFSNVTCF
jgi:hypothetical protein